MAKCFGDIKELLELLKLVKSMNFTYWPSTKSTLNIVSRTGCVRWKPCAPFSLSHPESLNTLWCFHLITLLCIQNRFEEWLEHFKCFKFNNCITWSKNQWIRYLTYHCFRQISAGNGYPNSVNDFNFSENNSTIHASDPLKHLNPANHLGGWVHVC